MGFQREPTLHVEIRLPFYSLILVHNFTSYFPPPSNSSNLPWKWKTGFETCLLNTFYPSKWIDVDLSERQDEDRDLVALLEKKGKKSFWFQCANSLHPFLLGGKMCVCVTRVPLCPLHSTYISTYTYTIPATFLPLHYCLFLPSFRFEFSRTLCESLLSPLIQDFGSASVELPDKAGKTQLSLSPNYTSLPFAFV